MLAHAAAGSPDASGATRPRAARSSTAGRCHASALLVSSAAAAAMAAAALAHARPFFNSAASSSDACGRPDLNATQAAREEYNK